MAYEISVVAGGEVTESVFNAIAAFFNGASFSSILGLIMAISVPASVIRYMTTRDHNHIVRWFLTYALVPAFLIVPKTDIIIKDMSQPGLMKHVDNVPAGLAFSAYLGSLLQTAVPEVIDAIFHYPDEIAYNKTGFMFGSSLYRLSSKVGITDSNLARIWTHYISNCIRPDILLWKKYTFNELAQAPNIFEFLKSHNPSPLNRVTMDIGDYQTCQEALPKIERMFKEDSKVNLKYLGVNYYGKNAAREALFLEQSLQGTYSFFTGISRNATDVITQNMAINGIKSGLMSSAAAKNATAAAMNYGKAQTDAQSTSMFLQMGHMMQEYLPIIQTILFLLLIVAFIPMVILAMLPDLSFTVPTKYIGSFFHICSWPIWFTFIHYISLGFLLPFTTGAADTYGGVTLSNTNQLQAMHTKFAAVAGYLLVFVPYFSNMLLKGAGAMLGTLATSMTSIISSATSQGARAMATGDLQLGNTSINNHSRNNLSANKHDTNYSDMYGRESYQDATGGILTRNADGSYTAQAAISRGFVNFSSDNQAAVNTEKAAQLSHQKSLENSKAAQQSFGSVMQHAKLYSENEGNSQNTNESYMKDVSVQTGKDLKTLHDMRNRYGEDAVFDYLHGKHDTKGVAFNASAGGSASISGGGGRSGSGGAGVNVGFGTNYENKRSSADDSKFNLKNNEGITVSDGKELTESYQRLSKDAKTFNASDGSTKGQNFVDDLRSDLSEAINYSEQSNFYAREAVDLSERASVQRSDTNRISYDRNALIQDELDRRYGSGTGTRLMLDRNLPEDHPQLVAAEKIVDQRIMAAEEKLYQQAKQRYQTKGESFAHDPQIINQKDRVLEQHAENTAMVPTVETTAGQTGFNQKQFDEVRNQYKTSENKVNNQIEKDGDKLIKDYEYVKKGVDDNVVRGRKTTDSWLFGANKVDIKDVRPKTHHKDK